MTRADPNLGRLVVGQPSPHALATVVRSWLLAETGHLREARVALDEGVELARALDDAETLGWGLGFYARLAWLSGEPQDSLARAREGAEIAERLGSSFSLLIAYQSLCAAHAARGEWDEARRAAERALGVIEDAHTSFQAEPGVLTALAEARVGGGDHAAAVDAAKRAIDLARRRNTRALETEGCVVLAHALRGRDGTAANDRIAALLADANALATETGARSHLPRIHVELAELARLNGDHERDVRELREAHRLYEEIGATRHAARIATQLAALRV